MPSLSCLLQPDTLGALPNLRELWLDRNQLSALPPVSVCPAPSTPLPLPSCSPEPWALLSDAGAGQPPPPGVSGCI